MFENILFQQNNVERAADWIFSHAGELDAPMEVDAPQEPTGQRPNYRDGNSSELYKT